jgi:hypothetical protein
MHRNHYARIASITVCSLLAIANVLSASNEPSESTWDETVIQANCNVAGYTSQTLIAPPLLIPDNDPAGVRAGPLIVPADGTIIDDVVVALQVNHGFIGDLRIVIEYDADSNGAVDATSVIVCQPNRPVCPASGGPPFGCFTDMSCTNTYLFDDTGATQMGLAANGSCNVPITNTDIVPGGCYRPTGSGATPLSAFDGLSTAGTWWLRLEDHQQGDIGVLCSWTMHVLGTGPTSIEGRSWGRLKAAYR